jgi:secreted PhoX family phosphatase
LGELIDHRLSRRGFLSSVLGTAVVACVPKKSELLKEDLEASLLAESSFDFPNLPAVLDRTHHVSEGYEVEVLVRWGDPIFPDMEPFSWEDLTGEEQAKRFGHGNDYIAYFPLTAESALLVINQESTVAALMFEGERDYVASDSKHAPVEMMAHGLSVVEIQSKDGKWNVNLKSEYNRRITANSEMLISGPVAGHDRMKTPADSTGTKVKGTLHNCSGGTTPWGTILTCEENILYYFEGTGKGTVEEQNFARLKIGKVKAYNWGSTDPRFLISHSLNEANRFGWVVEVDPKNVDSVPVKRTALGRFFHESSNPIVNFDGKVAIYMGDDGYFEYLYRFISEDSFVEGGANSTLLDAGELSVARFYQDGTMEWLPLIFGENGLTQEHGFNSQADVLIETRRAGDILKATKMDRIEDVEPDILTDKIYINCTKNKKRGKEGKEGANPANSRIHNIAGHTIELIPPNKDHSSMTMTWEILLLAGDEEMGSDYGISPLEDAQFACPDNAVFDPKGRLWITTDGSTDCFPDLADGFYAIEKDGVLRGQSRRLFLAPIGAEVTGPCFSPDGKSLFLSIQHPGHVDEVEDEFVTRWPDFDANTPPRPSVIVIRRTDGGIIGG